MLFFRTAKFWLLTSRSQLRFLIDHLVINPTNTGVFSPNYPEVLHHSENLFIKYHEQNFSALNKAIYRIMLKNSVFGMFNKNIYFSTEYQYWIS